MGNPAARPAQRRPSIKTVAALAGVSWSTVSNVINDHPSVRPETRARVEEAIEVLGYRPNAAGRSLRRGSTGTVLLAVAGLTIPLHAEIVEAVTSQCRLQGFGVQLEVVTDEISDVRRFLDHVRPVDREGTLIVGAAPVEGPPTASGLRPLLLVAPAAAEDRVVEVSTNPRDEMSLVLDWLMDHERSRVGLVIPQRHRTMGLGLFAEAVTSRGLTLESGAVIVAHDETFEEGRRLARSLPQPAAEALVCTHDELAAGLAYGLREVFPVVAAPGARTMVCALRSSRLSLGRYPEMLGTVPNLQALATASLGLLDCVHEGQEGLELASATGVKSTIPCTVIEPST